jgi:hypothetical protein
MVALFRSEVPSATLVAENAAYETDHAGELAQALETCLGLSCRHGMSWGHMTPLVAYRSPCGGLGAGVARCLRSDSGAGALVQAIDMVGDPQAQRDQQDKDHEGQG